MHGFIYLLSSCRCLHNVMAYLFTHWYFCGFFWELNNPEQVLLRIISRFCNIQSHLRNGPGKKKAKQNKKPHKYKQSSNILALTGLSLAQPSSVDKENATVPKFLENPREEDLTALPMARFGLRRRRYHFGLRSLSWTLCTAHPRQQTKDRSCSPLSHSII